MAVSMKENTIVTKSMDKVHIFGQMEIFIKVVGLMVRGMEKQNTQ